MRRQTLSFLCTVTLLAVTVLAPASALARPVRTAPSLDLRIDAPDVVPDASFTPSAAADGSPKPVSPPVEQVGALAADAFPGDPVQWVEAYDIPITGNVNALGSRWDFYSIYLEPGEQVVFELFGAGTSADLDLFLYDPNQALAEDLDGNNYTSIEAIEGEANLQGTWSIAVYAASGADDYELYGYFASPDDDVPAVAIPPSPVATTLDSYSDWDDVYRIWLNAGEVLSLSLNRGSAYTGDFYPNLYLYPPGTQSVWGTAAAVDAREGLTFPKSITFGVATSGYYYVDLYELAGRIEGPADDTHDFGEVILTWKVSSPVYRFYNFTNNTHFFTPSLDEANSVIAKWSNVFRYEGVSYYTNPANNTQPLFRFYNRNSRSHFYTASVDEANTIVARYSNVFTYDGQTYAVNPGAVANSAPVYRFFNLRNGSHFYTASAEEADMVIATWPTIYRYEGPAFWIGQ